MKVSWTRRGVQGLFALLFLYANPLAGQPSPCDFLPAGGIEGSTFGRGEQPSYGIYQDCQRDFSEPALHRVYISRYVPAKLDSAYQAMRTRDSSDLDRFPYSFVPISGLGDGPAWERTGLGPNRGSGSLTFRRGVYVVQISFNGVPESVVAAMSAHARSVALAIDPALARGVPNGPGAPPSRPGGTTPPAPPTSPGVPTVGTPAVPAGSGVPGTTTTPGGVPPTDPQLELLFKEALAGMDVADILRRQLRGRDFEGEGPQVAKHLSETLLTRLGTTRENMTAAQAQSVKLLELVGRTAVLKTFEGVPLFPSLKALLPVLGKLAEWGASDPAAIVTFQRVVSLTLRLDTRTPER